MEEFVHLQTHAVVLMVGLGILVAKVCEVSAFAHMLNNYAYTV